MQKNDSFWVGTIPHRAFWEWRINWTSVKTEMVIMKLYNNKIDGLTVKFEILTWK